MRLFLSSPASERALLDTVRSRLRPVRFPPLTPAEVEEIVVARGNIDKKRAHAIARLARGSAARGLALIEGDEPPLKELLDALHRAKRLDFAGANAIAQEHFGNREQAADNFELMARLLEEILCAKLLGDVFAAASPEDAAYYETARRFLYCRGTGGLSGGRGQGACGGRSDGELPAAGRAALDDGGASSARRITWQSTQTHFKAATILHASSPSAFSRPGICSTISPATSRCGAAIACWSIATAACASAPSSSNRMSPRIRSICRILKPVIRLVDAQDLRTEEENLDREARARRLCIERIHERGMAMKLVNVDYAFDGRKAVFLFHR